MPGCTTRRRLSVKGETAGQPLSPTEREVAALITQEYQDQEIAAQLCLATKTVTQYAHHIRRKVGARTRVGIATWWVVTQGVWWG